MRLSEREQRAPTDIEARLVSADPRYVQRCDDISSQIPSGPQTHHPHATGAASGNHDNTGTAKP